jgi:hypothetical protein
MRKSKVQFLGLGNIETLSQKILCWRGLVYAEHCKLFSSILIFYPPEANNTPTLIFDEEKV